MHAQQIIQDSLSIESPYIHAKRRDRLAAAAETESKGFLGLPKSMPRSCSLLHELPYVKTRQGQLS